MTSALGRMTVPELVDRFVAITLDQDQAQLHDDIGRFNRLFDQMIATTEELKNRPGDQRRALMALYEHDNAQVRLKAAKATLAVVPAAARLQLEAIAASRHYPQAGEAGMSIWNLDRGVYKPT